MKHFVRGRMAMALTLSLLSTGVSAQGFQFPTPTNLQVLPEGTEGSQVRTIMMRFTRALGVRCSHCHVGEEGKPLSEYDFASDEKETKRAARTMMRMTSAINGDFIASLDRPEALRVTCETCHRGNARPTTLQDELSAAWTEGGVDAVTARFESLLSRFEGGFTFDFRPESVDAFAARLVADGHVDDGIAMYRYNLRRHPDWAGGHVGLGQALLEKGDREGARAEFDAALAIDPQDRGARMAIQRMEGND